MAFETRTTTRLLEGLHDPTDEAIWAEFDARYRPIILGFARKLGASDADAADVAQETLAAFVADYRRDRYDRARGRLRSWLMGIAKHRMARVIEKNAARRGWRGDSAFEVLPADAELDAMWTAERRATIVRKAVDELRATSRLQENTIEAFEMLVLGQRPAAVVAGTLGMTLDDVYQAKNRVGKKLRELTDRLEQLYEEDP